jgi:hypothetical protein
VKARLGKTWQGKIRGKTRTRPGKGQGQGKEGRQHETRGREGEREREGNSKTLVHIAKNNPTKIQTGPIQDI